MREFASDPPVERRVNEVFAGTDETIAVAEGSTGGLVATLLTDVPGASEFLERALVPYSYDSLRELLAVSRETLDEHGVVSAPATLEIARGVRDTAKATWGLAVMGVAGPDGGTAATPVGTTFVAVAYAGDWGTETSDATVERFQFDGDRAAVRERAARRALSTLLARRESKTEPGS